MTLDGNNYYIYYYRYHYTMFFFTRNGHDTIKKSLLTFTFKTHPTFIIKIIMTHFYQVVGISKAHFHAKIHKTVILKNKQVRIFIEVYLHKYLYI